MFAKHWNLFDIIIIKGAISSPFSAEISRFEHDTAACLTKTHTERRKRNGCAPVAQHLLLKSAQHLRPRKILVWKERSITTLPHLWTRLFRDMLLLFSLLVSSSTVTNGRGYTIPHASLGPNVRAEFIGRNAKRKLHTQRYKRIPDHPVGNLYI